MLSMFYIFVKRDGGEGYKELTVDMKNSKFVTTLIHMSIRIIIQNNLKRPVNRGHFLICLSRRENFI